MALLPRIWMKNSHSIQYGRVIVSIIYGISIKIGHLRTGIG